MAVTKLRAKARAKSRQHGAPLSPDTVHACSIYPLNQYSAPTLLLQRFRCVGDAKFRAVKRCDRAHTPPRVAGSQSNESTSTSPQCPTTSAIATAIDIATIRD